MGGEVRESRPPAGGAGSSRRSQLSGPTHTVPAVPSGGAQGGAALCPRQDLCLGTHNYRLQEREVGARETSAWLPAFGPASSYTAATELRAKTKT